VTFQLIRDKDSDYTSLEAETTMKESGWMAYAAEQAVYTRRSMTASTRASSKTITARVKGAFWVVMETKWSIKEPGEMTLRF